MYGRFTSDDEKKIYYIFGRLEAHLESEATSNQIPFPILAKRLADLLQLSSSRALLGTGDNLSPLPRKTTRRNKRQKKMEMVGKSHRHQTLAQRRKYKKMWYRARSAKSPAKTKQAIEWLKKYRARKAA